MSERPTPEQIAKDGTKNSYARNARKDMLYDLRKHGYVIVHPDDVPDYLSELAKNNQRDYDYGRGWNDCRDHVFGGSHE